MSQEYWGNLNDLYKLPYRVLGMEFFLMGTSPNSSQKHFTEMDTVKRKEA